MDRACALMTDRLLSGESFEGKLCGFPGQKTDNGALLDYSPLLYYSMNLTSILDATVGGYFSSSNTTDFDPAAVGVDMASILDPYTLWKTSGNGLISQISSFFIPVCVRTCDYNVTIGGGVPRTYIWQGPSDPTQKVKWDQYANAALTAPELMDPFTFQALPQRVCPYHARDCIPFQFAPVTSVFDKYCVPKVSNGLSSVIPSEWGNTLSIGFGDMLGDIVTAWPVILIMAFGGLLISLIFLFILRLCVGVFIWLAIFLCFLLILAGAITSLLWSQKCVNESMFAQAVAVDTQAELVTVLEGTTACRYAVRCISYTLFGLAGFYLIMVLVLRKRVKLGIAINKVASQFVRQNKASLFVPILQSLCLIGWWALWLVVAIYTVTTIPPTYRNMTDTWTDDYATAEVQCAGSAGVYIRSYDPDTSAPIFACKEAKYVLNWQLWYSLGALFWINAFILASGQMIVAGAVGVWYFTPNHSKNSLGTYPIRTGFRNTFIYHLGTVAFGSLILAVMKLVRLFFFWQVKLNQQATKRNRAIACAAACLLAVLKFIEKILAFLNKNAFIQTALMGTNFCKSCANAVSLVIRNAARIGTLGVIGGVVHVLGLAFITTATGLAGWGILASWFDGKIKSPIVPVAVMLVLGYSIGSIVISVFSIAVDAILQCFVSDEELHKAEGGAKFTPVLLQQFISSDDGKAAGVEQPHVVGVGNPSVGGQPVNVVQVA